MALDPATTNRFPKITEQGLDDLRKRIGIARRHEQPGHAIFHHLGNAADARGDDGARHGLRLQDDLWNTLVRVGGQHQHVDTGQHPIILLGRQHPVLERHQIGRKRAEARPRDADAGLAFICASVSGMPRAPFIRASAPLRHGR